MSGSFYLTPLAAPAKPRAKSRSSANMYPIFLQLSYFIQDRFWQNIFKQMAANNLPNSFMIKKNQLIHHKGNTSTFSLQLVVIGVNEELGLNGLNNNFIPYVNACSTQLYTVPRVEIINNGTMAEPLIITSEQLNLENDKSLFYIINYLLTSATIESTLLQRYILEIIDFFKKHAGIYSPNDYQRFHTHQLSQQPRNNKIEWIHLDKNIRRNLYDEFVNCEISKLALTPWQRNYVKTQLNLYYCYGQVKDEHVVLTDGKITAIAGINLSVGIPTFANVFTKSRSSNTKPTEDPLIKRWRNWLGVFEY